MADIGSLLKMKYLSGPCFGEGVHKTKVHVRPLKRPLIKTTLYWVERDKSDVLLGRQTLVLNFTDINHKWYVSVCVIINTVSEMFG